MLTWLELEARFLAFAGPPHARLDVAVTLPAAGGPGRSDWRLAGHWPNEVRKRFEVLADTAGRRFIERALTLSDEELQALVSAVGDEVAPRAVELIAADQDPTEGVLSVSLPDFV